jgi:hypothetical protein
MAVAKKPGTKSVKSKKKLKSAMPAKKKPDKKTTKKK